MITFIMGPSCAGKSTKARELQAPGDIIVDFDSLAIALGSEKSHDHPGPIMDAVHPVRVLLENKALDGEFSSDVWAIRSWMKPELIKSFGEKGAKFMVLDPGKEVALQRAKDEERPDGTTARIEMWYENPPEIPDEYKAAEKKDMPMKTKAFAIELKEAPADTPGAVGVFTGYASIFNNVDSYGDMVIPGAFTETLKAFGEAGANIPCYWGHQMEDPMKCIGWTTAAEEDERGLKVTVQLDLDNPNGAQAYKLIKAGVVNQMSFAYEVQEGSWVDSKENDHNGWGGYYELRKLKIFEVSLVQVGANQETELLDVKDRLARVKAGRKISATNEEKLNQAIALISEVLETDTPEEGSSEEPDDGKAEERESAKAEDQTQAKARTLSPVEIAQYELDLL